jgi:fumarate hydratase subunit beta
MVENLRIGQRVLLNGVVYVVEEMAHKKMVEMIEQGKELPIPLAGQVLFYATSTPARPGRKVGSIGPSTSERMDLYTPQLIARGLKGMIGIGRRSPEVIKATMKHKAVYFAAVGGASALNAGYVKSGELAAYPELGDEAIHKLVLEGLPVIVVYDIFGGNLYDESIRIYADM